MTLQQLEYIVSLDTHRHFVTAAESCFVTQPTLTMQVKKLEDEIGVLIFDRKKQPLEPTKAGERIINQSRQILRSTYQLKEMVTSEQGSMEGAFRIGVIPTIAPYLIPLFIGNFVKKHPKTRLIIEELKTDTIISHLRNDKIDIGIAATPIDEQHIREVPMFDEPFRVYTSEKHHLHGRKEVTPRDVENANDLWLLNQGHCFRNQVLNICKSNKSNSEGRNLVYESGSIETIKRLIDTNGGFTLIPELSARANDLNVVLFKDPQPVREVSLLVHSGFTKELLIENLRKEILNHLPASITKSKKYKRIKWR